VPAAAVIPALIAYIKVVAVKKLVVGSWSVVSSVRPLGCALAGPFFPTGHSLLLLIEWEYPLLFPFGCGGWGFVRAAGGPVPVGKGHGEIWLFSARAVSAVVCRVSLLPYTAPPLSRGGSRLVRIGVPVRLL